MIFLSGRVGRAAVVCGLVIGAAQPIEAAIMFLPGTYSLSNQIDGAAIDTLTITISGGIASFNLTGVDNESFTLPNDSTSGGFFTTASGRGGNPYYSVASGLANANFDTSIYPYVTFYTSASSGGLTIASTPGDAGNRALVNLFESSSGTAQVFSNDVPEPATWALMLGGFGLVGAAMRRQRAKVRFAQ